MAPEEQRHQQELLLTMLRWALVSVPLIALATLASAIRAPSWPGFALFGELTLLTAVCAWGLPRVRRGELRVVTRLALALVLACLTTHLLSVDERLRASTMLGFALTILLSIALEPPRVGLIWSFAATALALGGLFAPELVDIPKLPLHAGNALVIEGVALASFLLFAQFGRSTTRHFRRALAASNDAREAIARSNAELEQQKAELQTAEAHLSGLASRLEDRHQELQGFARVVSNDLRAPLQDLGRNSRTLHERYASRFDATAREYLQGITDSARHMDALVSGLLTYSSLERTGLDREPVDVGALVERVASVLDLRARAELRLAPDLPTVCAHRLRLEQILSNLLDNAVKFQRAGVRPVVSVEWADRGDAWELSVRDNGIGIEPKHFEKVFGIFERLHSQVEYEGTGIGLAIVKRAIEEHGGTVSVESMPGQGSAFRFTLPKPEGATAERPRSAPGERAPAVAPASAGAPAPPADGDLELTEEEDQHLRQLMSRMVIAGALVTPAALVAYAVSFVLKPSWSLAAPVLRNSSLLFLLLWSLRRLRRGELVRPTRILLTVLLLVVASHMLHREELVKVSGALAIALITLFFTAVERSSLALRWGLCAAALYLGIALVRTALPMPSFDVSPRVLDAFRAAPVFELLALGIFASSTFRTLRAALANSHAVRNSLEELHGRLAQQKAELLEAKARLSGLTEDLTRRNRDLQSFAYVASHDLRAPLRALGHYSRFLEDDCGDQLDEEGRAYVQRIVGTARHMDALVADLLEHSRKSWRSPG